MFSLVVLLKFPVSLVNQLRDITQLFTLGENRVELMHLGNCFVKSLQTFFFLHLVEVSEHLRFLLCDDILWLIICFYLAIVLANMRGHVDVLSGVLDDAGARGEVASCVLGKHFIKL
jgi:hypothetical protein